MASAKARPNRLRELREARCLTQREVAKVLDMDHTTVSKHESGDRSMGPEEIRAYATLYKVETHEIFIDPNDLGNHPGDGQQE